jgi:hypothetical protein
MSISAMVMVLDFAPAHWSSGTRLVALAIADRVGTDHECWPSIADIARRTGLRPRMVKYHAAILEGEGIIKREVRRRPNGSRQANLWVWLWTNNPAWCNTLHGGSATQCTPLVRDMVQHSAPLEPSLTNPHLEPSRERDSA